MLKKNDDIQLDIESVTSEGSAVGHYDGMAVFVRGAVPGDTIIAHIIKVSKRYAVATLKELLVESCSRIVSDCNVSSGCGGCSFRNMTYDRELIYKHDRVVDAVTRIGHLDVPVADVIGADDIDRYRNKAQYPVSIADGQLTVGFYAYKSHRIIPCSDCRLQPVEFEACIDAFSQWVRSANVDSYDENTGRGLLRHIYLRKAFGTGQIMACAVVNATTVPQQDLLVELLIAVPGVASVCININTRPGNVVLGKTTVTVWGSESITDTLLGKKFLISPNSFYQVNHNQCEKLYAKVLDYAGLTGTQTVIDLYCGAGTIGLCIAHKAKRIIGVEIIPQAIENAKINANINNIDNAEFFCGDAFDLALSLENRGISPDVVILDPPRKGCQKELFDVISRMSPHRIVYVSCDSATLA
ncbi:MAG: 23S rRNA (uracil(1939)-C(5))-methyltransferase RlmD, partial [Eubacteriales bacterium]|nr:23S rRNA (uracil(1939)-C(5))-methyltransferase RlmD [Eubacteriales bacterium]